MTWQPTRPSTEDEIAEIPSVLQGNWSAIDEIFGVAHYKFGTSLSGRHVAGQPGLVYTGSQTAIDAITIPVSGALALASGTGMELYYNGAWKDVGRNGWSHVRAYLSTSIPFTACTTHVADTQIIIFDTESFDTLGEYNNTTGTFTASAAGPYVVTASVCLCANATCATFRVPQEAELRLTKLPATTTVTAATFDVSLFDAGTFGEEPSTLRKVYARIPVVGTEIDYTVNLFDTTFLTAGDSLQVELTKSRYNDVLSAGSKNTFLSISRISGRCF